MTSGLESEQSVSNLHGPVLAEAPPDTVRVSFGLRRWPDAATGLSLRRNFAWTLAGNLIYTACQWAVLIVIVKSTTPAMVGQFALALAVTAPIMILANQ